MIKLVVSDIDGTLIPDGYHTLKPRMKELVLELKEKGITFVAASGRQYPSMKKLFDGVEDEVIFVAENGAYVVCRDKEIEENAMDKTIAEELIGELRQLENCFLTVSVKDNLYIESNDEEFVDLLVNGYKNEITIVEDVLSYDLNIIKVSIYKKEIIDDLAKTIIPKWEDKLKVSLAGHRWLDFMDLNVDKGNSIARIQELLNIGVDETIVFGDNINDLGMLKRARDSYAVANAREEVKAAAKHITDTNLNDGVIKVLETLI